MAGVQKKLLNLKIKLMSNDFKISDLKCPNCNTNFVITKEPDLEYEKCQNCNGIFLDEGELNTMTTGVAGNVELHFINVIEQDDKTNKKCPKCQADMQKAHFGNYSNITLDYCSKCSGCFLSLSTEKEINEYLKSLTRNKSDEEFRDYVNGVLVRVDIEEGGIGIGGSGKMIIPGYTPQNYFILTAFYKEPLNIDLFITQENLLFKILKLFLRNNFGEKSTGNKQFDHFFKIHTTDDNKLRKYINEPTISKIMNFIKKNPTIYGVHGKLAFHDDKLTYKEGPYINSISYNDDKNFRTLINDLVELARLIH